MDNCLQYRLVHLESFHGYLGKARVVTKTINQLPALSAHIHVRATQLFGTPDLPRMRPQLPSDF